MRRAPTAPDPASGSVWDSIWDVLRRPLQRPLWHALAPLLEREPPEPLRRLEAALILRTFCRGIRVVPPRTRGLDAAGTLAVLREFSAACAELAWERGPVAPCLRQSLRREAEALGAAVRRRAGVGDGHAGALARYLYRGIGIELDIDEGDLAFGHCSFAARYAPRDCWLMSGFDEGFLCGLFGEPDARLVFSCRMSEGAPRCHARLHRCGGRPWHATQANGATHSRPIEEDVR